MDCSWSTPTRIFTLVSSVIILLTDCAQGLITCANIPLSYHASVPALRYRTKKYPDSIVHTIPDSLSIFKNCHSGEKIKKTLADSHTRFTRYVWTEANPQRLRIQKCADTSGRGLSHIINDTANWLGN